MVERSTPVDRGAGVHEQVDLGQAVEPGTHVRRMGGDIPAGAEVLSAGTVLGPAHVGVAASLGHRSLVVVPPLRVGVLSTGDELVEGPAPLQPGQIRDSNRPMLLAMVRRAGCEPVDLGQVADDEVLLEQVLRDGAARCDALVGSGGVSMGDFDMMKLVLNRLTDMSWMQIAIKPAKPFAFGLLDGTPVFGLPGNPVSSMVSFELLARPALRQMMGHDRLDRPRIVALAGSGMPRKSDGRVHYVRVLARWIDGNVVVDSVGGQGSHQLAATAGANALVVLPDGEGIVAGAPVDVLLLDELVT
jgi:molybdenum cofactor synthesis domain-containing protein